MPGNDGTGPMGKGSRTGRGLGSCGEGVRRGARVGFGRGFGRGFGWRNQLEDKDLDLSKEEQRKILEKQKKEIEERLEKLNQ